MSLDLFRHIQGEVRFDEPMRRHSSFRIGGPADVFVSPAGVDDLLYRVARSRRVRDAGDDYRCRNQSARQR